MTRPGFSPLLEAHGPILIPSIPTSNLIGFFSGEQGVNQVGPDVVSWVDQSGANIMPLLSSAPGSYPQTDIVTIPGKTGIYFSPALTAFPYLDSGPFVSNPSYPFTIYSVVKWSGVNPTCEWYQMQPGTGSQLTEFYLTGAGQIDFMGSGFASAVTSPTVIASEVQAGSCAVDVNGPNVGSNIIVIGPGTLVSLTLGNNAIHTGHGCETIFLTAIYNAAHSFATRHAISTIIGAFYGIPIT